MLIDVPNTDEDDLCLHQSCFQIVNMIILITSLSHMMRDRDVIYLRQACFAPLSKPCFVSPLHASKFW
jgi:hypothetical protein